MVKGSGKRWSDPKDLPHAFKVLCPEELVACLMGSGGRVKDALQEETGARLVVSQRDEYFPGTRLRILSIFHQNADGIATVLSRILDRIVECAEQRPDASTGVAGEPDFKDDRGEFVIRVAVSPAMARVKTSPGIGGNARVENEGQGVKGGKGGGQKWRKMDSSHNEILNSRKCSHTL